MHLSRNQSGLRPRGRIYLKDPGSAYPGWHLQFYEGRDLKTVRLHIEETESLNIALVEAAGFLGCSKEQLQFEGDEWPTNILDAD